jgi:hypothetical protein
MRIREAIVKDVVRPISSSRRAVIRSARHIVRWAESPVLHQHPFAVWYDPVVDAANRGRQSPGRAAYRGRSGNKIWYD